MVIEDFFHDEEIKKSPLVLNGNHFNLASYQDRALAFFLDLLIFSPIVSFFIYKWTKDFRILSALDNKSTIYLESFVQLFFLTSGIVVFIYSIFFYIAQATPGQKFLKLQVVSMIDSKARLTFLQSILRGLFTVVGFGLLGLPFLEILVHPWRRGFHDKMSDTILVTAKKRIKNDLPHKPYLEAQLVKYYLSWSFGSIMLFMLLALIISQIETIPTNGRRPASISEKQDVTIDAQVLKCGEKDFTEVLNLWRTEKLSQECLLSSADKLLWSKKSSVLNRQKAYAIKGILDSDDSKALQYLIHSQRPTEKIKDKENVSPNAHRL